MSLFGGPPPPPARHLDTGSRVPLRWQRWLGMAAIGGIVCCVVALALMDHPVFASRVFALCVAGIALARVVFRDRRVWFAARAWWVDAAVLLAVAAALGYLSFYGGRVMPAVG